MPPRLSLPRSPKVTLADLRNGLAACVYTPRLPPSLVRMAGACRNGLGVLEGRMGEEKSAGVVAAEVIDVDVVL